MALSEGESKGRHNTAQGVSPILGYAAYTGLKNYLNNIGAISLSDRRQLRNS